MGAFADEQARLDQALTEFETLPARADARIEELEARLATLTAADASDTETVAALKTELQQAKEQLAAVTDENIGHLAFIKQQAEDISRLEPALEDANDSLAEMTVTLSKRDQTIAAQGGLLDQQAATILKQNQVISDLKAQLSQSAETGVPLGYTALTAFAPDKPWLESLAASSGDVWVPEGTYEFDAWKTGQKQTIVLPKGVTSFDGPGIDKATFLMRPNTSQWPASSTGSATTSLSTLQQTGGQLRHMGGFTLACTPQGHNYHGWSIYNPVNVVRVENVQTLGGKGTSGSPPGETFQATVHGGPKGHRVVNCRFDGSMEGVPQAAVGLTFQDCTDALAINCVFIDHQASAFVNYQVFDSGIEDCKFYIPTERQYRLASACINLGERTSGDICRRVSIFGGVYKYSTHFSHSNDFSPVRDKDGNHVVTNGVPQWRHYSQGTRDTNNGPAIIEDPITWPDWWNKKGTGKTEQITPATMPSGYSCIIIDTWGATKATPAGEPYFKYGPDLYSQESTKDCPLVYCNQPDGTKKYLPIDWNQYGKHRKVTPPYRSPEPASLLVYTAPKV
jgi:hypothetical protein